MVVKEKAISDRCWYNIIIIIYSRQMDGVGEMST